MIYLRKKLNRPMRVCGVVKNVGEPGGGPFLTYNSDGTVLFEWKMLHITTGGVYMAIFTTARIVVLVIASSMLTYTTSPTLLTEGTHFNPVDLVCATKDFKGNDFDLPKYVDPKTGFISNKSKNGKELKALELPGLWNGAMSDWNTVFVEVPLSTFNPVKTVNDLLRDQHQAKV